MTTETIDTAALRALAEAAPAGPWNAPDEIAHRGTVYDRDLGALLTYRSISTERDQCVRYVAAANPAVMLALLDRLAAAEARNATLTDDAARLEFLASVAKEEFLRPSHDAEFFDHRMYWKLPTLMFINASGHEWTFRQAIDAQRARAAASISTKGDGP